MWTFNEENSRFLLSFKITIFWLNMGELGWTILAEMLKMILGCWSTFWIHSESPFCDCQKPCGSRGSNFVKFDEDFVISCLSGWSPNLWSSFKLFRWRVSVFVILFGIISTIDNRTFGFLVCQIIRLDSQFQLILIKYWGLEIPHWFLSSLDF